MSALRRDVLKLAGGAAAGLLFTPAPWRLLGDSAMWTQNWSWLPKVPRGPVTDVNTHCTLCRANCPVRARCTGGVPTGLWPAGQPLCPAGFAAHHFSMHLARLRHGTRPRAEIVSLLKERAASGLMVLDLAPGRTASYAVRHLLGKLPGAVYTEAPAIEGATAAAVARLTGRSVAVGLDLAKVRTLLSVRTPVMEGWASPARVNAGPLGFRLLQAEPRKSHTGELAAQWMEVEAGREREFLLAVTGEILRRKPAAARPGVEELRAAASSVAVAHPAAGRVAEELLAEGPAAVVADGDPANGPLAPMTVAVAAAINAMLDGSGYAERAEAPLPAAWKPVAVTELAAIADGSIRTLVIDEPAPGASLPWDLVSRKLAADAVVVGLTWASDGAASRAQQLLPTPVFLEGFQDAGPAVDAVAATFAVSRPFLPAPADAVDCVALVSELAGETMSATEALQQRAAAIRAAGRGSVLKPGETEAASMESFKKDEDFWTALQDGACWRSAEAERPVRAARLLPAGVTAEMLLRRGPEGKTVRTPGWRPAGASPLIAKLWRESDIRRAPGERVS